jgi:hypothetical protein
MYRALGAAIMPQLEAAENVWHTQAREQLHCLTFPTTGAGIIISIPRRPSLITFVWTFEYYGFRYFDP